MPRVPPCLLGCDLVDNAQTWSTTYVQLVAEGIELPAASRIVVDCDVWLETSCPYYDVKVSTGAEGAEEFFSQFTWEGCS